MRDLFRNEHAVILYYINVFMSPFTLSLHLFFDRPLFLRRAVDCHYKTRQTAARQTEHAPNWKNAPNCRAPIWHRVEVGRAQLDRVKQARVKKDAPKWTGIVSCCAITKWGWLGGLPSVKLVGNYWFCRSEIFL